MPTSSRINACRAGSTSIRTPSASSVSAVPAIDDAARDPVLDHLRTRARSDDSNRAPRGSDRDNGGGCCRAGRTALLLTFEPTALPVAG